MPTYQYQCTECGEGLEAVQKFTDDALTECPNCQGRLKKVFSAVGIVFKGSGFYRNDSRGSSSSSTPASKTSG
ncbi:FmdB family zinc ribbon protein, partial [Streptomyces prasinopilosus]